VRVLFFMRTTVYVRNFESTLRLLAERGHHVHVVATPHYALDPTDLMGRLCREYPAISCSPAAPGNAGRWSRLGFEIRRAIDYLRYLQPEYRGAAKLRRRAERKAPAFVTTALTWPLMNTRGGRWLLGRVLRWSDRAVPRDPAVDAYVREQRPDLVLVTPLVETGSPQSEYVRSARALGIPTGLCVHSWDNLTNKGLIHDRLDLVTVWNQSMKDEAVALHGIPAESVVVTGASAYDHWFAWKPRAAREIFCARVGLDRSRPYLLYVCSSRFIAPDELPFIRRWIQEVRAASSTLRDVGVLVRPHPQVANDDVWREADFSDLGHVVIWPRTVANPVDAESRSDYYDSIYHSAAVVGVNTSALIESGIVGRGVYTLLAPEFSETQEGTLHFHHLRDVNGGLLHIASNLAEHVTQLEAALHDPHSAAERCRRFVEAFVRPSGLEEAATPRLVAALEATAARGPVRPDRGPWWAPLARPALARAAAAFAGAEPAYPLPGAEPQLDGRVSKAPKAQRRRARAKWQERKKRRAATKNLPVTDAARAPAPAAPPVPTDAFEHYLRVRDHVRVFREEEPTGDAVTPSERRMSSELDVLWDASPEIVSLLRHQCRAITGVSASDYQNSKPSARTRLEHELTRLLQYGDPELWVAEPTILGGFGFNGLGKLYNEDTLRFFRVISLLQEAALMKEFHDTDSRRTVWEIGGGWGGFAYQFKTLCPNVTYLITGAPEMSLLSAVYLMTLFPTARFRFYDRACPAAFWQDWENIDFAFAPESVVAEMRPPSVDLAVDVMMLERMSVGRIVRHVQRAYDLGARYFVSVCASDPDPAIGSPVQPAVERLYWRHPVSAPEYLAKRFAVRAGRGVPIKRTYFLGWKRLHV
jgi:hypothetical protein